MQWLVDDALASHPSPFDLGRTAWSLENLFGIEIINLWIGCISDQPCLVTFPSIGKVGLTGSLLSPKPLFICSSLKTKVEEKYCSMTELWPLCLGLVLLIQPLHFLFGVNTELSGKAAKVIFCSGSWTCLAAAQARWWPSSAFPPQLSSYRSHCMFGRRPGSLSAKAKLQQHHTTEWALALSSPASLWSLVFQIAYAAVDCAKGQNHDLCKQEGVDGYPTFNYYNYGKFVEKYTGDRGVSEGESHHLVQGESLPCLSCLAHGNCRVNFYHASAAVLHGWIIVYHTPVHLCIRNTLGLFLGMWEVGKGLDLVILFVYFIL